jgi:hypothetical protein
MTKIIVWVLMVYTGDPMRGFPLMAYPSEAACQQEMQSHEHAACFTFEVGVGEKAQSDIKGGSVGSDTSATEEK